MPVYTLRKTDIVTSLAAICLSIPLIFGKANAQELIILHTFGSTRPADDGRRPVCLMRATDGNFYGTTYAGGTTATGGYPYSGEGAVFRMNPSGAVTILHSFGDGSVKNDGANPNPGLIQGPDGCLYGTTVSGGSTATALSAGDGTVFRITLSGAVTILHSFDDGSVENDGFGPTAGLVQGTDGNFYGTTYDGGSTVAVDPYHYGYGTAFKITRSGLLTVLHSFGSVLGDGIGPSGLILGTDGLFYGTSGLGGSTMNSNDRNPEGYGTVFNMTANGTVSILHSFNDGSVTNDGATPGTGVVQGADGSFYGTTQCGGNQAFAGSTNVGDGTAFKIDPAGVLTILHVFRDGTVANDGISPGAIIEGSDGNWYGTTDIGGSTVDPNYSYSGFGTLYRMDPAGSVEILHSFGVTNTDGAYPSALIEGPDGAFYGTTAGGGLTQCGTAFRLLMGLSAPVPAAPSNLTATSGNRSVTLIWLPSQYATGYNIYRGTSPGHESTTPVASGVAGRYYVDIGLNNGTKYYYTVKAQYGTGLTRPSNEAHSEPEPPAPAAPTQVVTTSRRAQN